MSIRSRGAMWLLLIAAAAAAISTSRAAGRDPALEEALREYDRELADTKSGMGQLKDATAKLDGRISALEGLQGENRKTIDCLKKDAQAVVACGAPMFCAPQCSMTYCESSCGPSRGGRQRDGRILRGLAFAARIGIPIALSFIGGGGGGIGRGGGGSISPH